MRVALHVPSLEAIPVDFFADPDGRWEYEALVRSAGFDPASIDAAGVGPLGTQLSIGALTKAYSGFPEGAAVVMLSAADRCQVSLVDCTLATDVAA